MGWWWWWGGRGLGDGGRKGGGEGFSRNLAVRFTSYPPALAVFWRCALWCVNVAGPRCLTAAHAAKQHAVVALSAAEKHPRAARWCPSRNR